MKVSVIIPMYNESKIIADTAEKLSRYMKSNFESYEIIFCDDGSSDNSRQIVNDMNIPCVKAIGYEKNRGKGSAVRYAMLRADGDIRIFTDADLAYGMDVIKQAVSIMKDHTELDMLLGSRNIHKDGYQGYTIKRKLMSKMYIRVLCLVGGFKLSDSQCGFKAFRGKTANEIFSACSVDGFAFDFEVILRAQSKNKKIGEMPVKVINHRQSSVRPIGDAVAMLKDLRKIKKQVKGKH